jgi:hypothetical protein
MTKTNLKLLEITRRYRKTPKGVLTNMYNHMKTRHEVTFSLSEFHHQFLNDRRFKRLFSEWVQANYPKQLKPSLDRIDSHKPYSMSNVQMLTWAENRFKQAATDGKRGRKPAVLMLLNGKVVRRFLSQRHVVKELGLMQGNLSAVLNGKRETIAGHQFIYENPELLK